MTAAEQDLKQYLELLRDARMTGLGELPPGLAYAGAEDWLLHHGQFYAPPPASDERLGPQGQCYDTAFRRAARSRGRLRYCEGYATTVIPMPHAWCVTRDGDVVEATWRVPGTAYYGAIFSLDQLREARTHGSASMLQDNYRNHPMFAREGAHEKVLPGVRHRPR